MESFVARRVHQDIILTDQMFIEAKEEVILLPAKTRYEQDDGGTETTPEQRIIFSPEMPRQLVKPKPSGKFCASLYQRFIPNRHCNPVVKPAGKCVKRLPE